MTAVELLEILRRGEDSRHQFKRVVKHEMDLAEDIVAFSNCDGGQIFVGVADDGTVTGLTSREVVDLNKRISNAASWDSNKMKSSAAADITWPPPVRARCV